MMNYMQTGAGISLGLHIHFIFGTVLFLGVVFLIVLAIKYMKKDQLKKLTIWLLAVGLLGSLLTQSWGWNGWNSMWEHHSEVVKQLKK